MPAPRLLPRCEASEGGENLRTFEIARKILNEYNTPGAGKTLASRHQALATERRPTKMVKIFVVQVHRAGTVMNQN